MDPGVPGPNQGRFKRSWRGSDRALGSGAERQRYQGSTDRHSPTSEPVGSGARRHGAVENGWYRGRTGLSSRQDEGRLRVCWPRNEAREMERTSVSHHDRTKFILDEDRIPHAFYNIAADMNEPPPPPLNPGTGQPIGPGDLAPLFPMELIKQVVSNDREIEIPDPVREAYKLYRPSPLYRAHRLEKALDTPAHIYYKYEGVSPAGSHKTNTALAQAFYAKQEGVTRFATETGAGQWGSALAFACSVFGIDLKVYMVRASYDQKPYRRILMETYGAQIVASPSPDTQYGQKLLAQDPSNTGSLGIAISEAIEDTVTHPGTKYSLGSVFDFVLLHQTVIGQEAIEQMGHGGRRA